MGKDDSTATSPITGDRLVSKPVNENYRDGYDRIFKQKKFKEEREKEDVNPNRR